MLQFKDLEHIKKIATVYERYDSDYMYCRIENPSNGNLQKLGPIRFPALGIFLLHEGKIECEINMRMYKLQAPSVFIIAHNEMLNLSVSMPQHDKEECSDLLIDCLFLSINFMQSLNIDLKAINLPELLNRPLSVDDSTLETNELEIIGSYFHLLRHNASETSDMAMSKNIAQSLTQALIYQLLQIYLQKKHSGIKEQGTQQGRLTHYVHEFLQLVQLNYRSKRSINFYAQKMCISPKYLSHIIKVNTGRPAADWIAGCVIQEAKNMLRFSHKNIQQVAYELNFSSQSSFGKYFKHVTGMSPTEYKKQ